MTTPARRQLSLHHFAFIRGYLQGLPLPALAQRYLNQAVEEGGPRRTLAFVRDTLRALALQHGQLRYARALAIDPSRLTATAPGGDATAPPTLEAFRRQIDPSGFYSEADLIDLYQQQVGLRRPDRRAARAARLRALQLDALDYLQARAQPEPRPEHRVEAWLPSRIAGTLEAAGVDTLDALVSRMNRDGFRWWTTVPGVGEEKAARLRHWLQAHAQIDGLKLARRAVVPRQRLGSASQLLRERAVRTEIAPLERFLVPRELDGREGRLRGARAGQQIAADNDYEAITAWLSARATNDHTYRAYRREAERLLLWCVFAQGKALSSITVEDCTAYREFLQAPPQAWVSARNTERWSPAWRPLSGPLAPRSLRTAFTIVSALFDWLASQGYLVANPWKALPRPGRAATLDLSRAFTHEQWAAIRVAVEQVTPTARRIRLQLVIEMLYHTGLRRAELLAADLTDLREEVFDGDAYWILTVTGKGGRMREVPVHASVIDLLQQHLRARGLAADPRDVPAGAPLLGAVAQPPKAGERSAPIVSAAVATQRRAGELLRMTAAQLYREFKQVVAQASADLAAKGARGAQRVANGSPHWMRHTFATHAVETIAPDVVGDILGHASLATTTLYMKTGIRRKVKALAKFGQT